MLTLAQNRLLTVLRIQCPQCTVIRSVSFLLTSTTRRRELTIGIPIAAPIGTVVMVSLSLGGTAVESALAEEEFDEGLHYGNTGSDSDSAAFDSREAV